MLVVFVDLFFHLHKKSGAVLFYTFNKAECLSSLSFVMKANYAGRKNITFQ